MRNKKFDKQFCVTSDHILVIGWLVVFEFRGRLVAGALLLLLSLPDDDGALKRERERERNQLYNNHTPCIVTTCMHGLGAMHKKLVQGEGVNR